MTALSHAAAPHPATSPPTLFDATKRFQGFLLSAVFSWLAGGLAWSAFGLAGSLLERNATVIAGYAWIGFVPAGVIHIAAYALPGALLWAFARPGSRVTRLPLALTLGFAIGSLPGVLLGIDNPKALFAAPLIGLLYGMPTAAINLRVYHRLNREP